jgi:hypothetical protein
VALWPPFAGVPWAPEVNPVAVRSVANVPTTGCAVAAVWPTGATRVLLEGVTAGRCALG